MAFHLLSVDNLQMQMWFALNEGASVVYWNHQLGHFDYLVLEEDRSQLTTEIMNFRSAIGRGDILSVFAAEPLVVGSHRLHAMAIEIKDQPCEAYFLVRRRGYDEDLKYTPYFFISEPERDHSVLLLGNGSRRAW